MALSVEASELVECFQWLTEEQSRSLSAQQLAAVTDEIADIQLYLIRLADKLDVDIRNAVSDKFKKNEAKYPADKVRGSAKKKLQRVLALNPVTGGIGIVSAYIRNAVWIPSRRYNA